MNDLANTLCKEKKLTSFMILNLLRLTLKLFPITECNSIKVKTKMRILDNKDVLF